MLISKLKPLLLAALCLTFFILSPAIQCMQNQERNDVFEAVVKRGYCDFLDRVGREKFKELGLEDPIEKQERERKIEVVSSRIHKVTGLFKLLHRSENTDQEILDVIESLVNMYDQIKSIDSTQGHYFSTVKDKALYLKACYETYYRSPKPGYSNFKNELEKIRGRQLDKALKSYILKDMEIYKILQGIKHPLWEEFC